MLWNSLYDNYTTDYDPLRQEDEKAIFLVCYESQLLLQINEATLSIPSARAIDELGIEVEWKHYLGLLSNIPVYAVQAHNSNINALDLVFREFRVIAANIDQDIFFLAERALHIINWYKNNQYCSRCGTHNELKSDERALLCPSCNMVNYPRISPAIIVAVIKDDEILLAHAKNFKNDMYSIIAGFVEPGETFEDCARRELLEEVGIKAKSFRYFGSQPWPFPDSLMVGFFAEYDSGDIVVDGVEIGYANWFRRDNMPVVPKETSIAGKMIKSFLSQETDIFS